MIKVKVNTYNDDLKRKSWQKLLCCRPMIGDLIIACDGTEAKIQQIYHDMDTNGPFLIIVVGLS